MSSLRRPEAAVTVDHFDLHIPGPVRGQGRPRFNRASGHAHTDAKSRSYAQRIEEAWYEAGCPALEDRVYYTVSVCATIKRPSTHFLSGGGFSAEGKRRPWPGKPDLDNCIKWLDALVACGAVPDDAYLIRIIADKHWGEDGLRFHLRAVR